MPKQEGFRKHFPRSLVLVSRTLNSCCGLCPEQILIELETALLDDKPHWYPLQTHDVSSIPLPQPSPYLPRRHTHTDASGKKLQRKSVNGLCKCKHLISQPPNNTTFASGCVSIYVCVFGVYTCAFVCVYDCLGSQRLSEPEYDEGTTVVSKGGWGLFRCLPQTGFICGDVWTVVGRDWLYVTLHRFMVVIS